MEYTRSSLARLTYSDAARELAERLATTADPTSDRYGRGAFLTEEANEILTAARDLLAAAVVADRQRGSSWAEVGEALDVTRQSAQERFVQAERDFRDAVLFPHRYPEHGGLGYTVAPYALEEPDHVRERLDQWVTAARPRQPKDPVTAGLSGRSAHAASERINDVLILERMMLDGTLPEGVSTAHARRRHAELTVDALQRVVRERPDDRAAVAALADARDALTALIEDPA